MKLTKAMTPTRHPQSIYGCKITYLIFFAILETKNLVKTKNCIFMIKTYDFA